MKITLHYQLYNIHSYNTRFKDSVHQYIPITNFGKLSLKYKAAKFYNNLLEEIRFDLPGRLWKK